MIAPNLKFDISTPVKIASGLITFLVALVLTLSGSWATNVNKKIETHDSDIVQLKETLASQGAKIEGIDKNINVANKKLDIIIERRLR